MTGELDPAAYHVDQDVRRRAVTLLGVDLCVASPEDVVISKLAWAKASGGSSRQLRDVSEMLSAQAGRLDLEYIERWVADLDLGAEWHAAKGSG